jgi:hypothetical protein
MTHSGGKPHTNVGDRGQRYEVRATGYPAKEQSVIGWHENIHGAEHMAQTIRKAPGCRETEIFDRVENRTMRTWKRRTRAFDPACRGLADHFLQDEPKLQHRADELAGEIQQTVEDWITVERVE